MIASDIWCFRAIAAIGSLPRMTSITISYRFSTVQRLGLGIVPRPARMNCSPPPRCRKAAEAPLKNAPLQQLFHNVLVQIEIHLSLLCALNRSNSKTVPNFLGRDTTSFTLPAVNSESFAVENVSGPRGLGLPPLHRGDPE